MDERTVGRETVQIVEIVQPLCANTFGVAPCNATGTADQRCFNTRATCRDSNFAGTNFALGAPLSLFFASGNVAEHGVPGVSYLIPSLVSVSTAPVRINMTASNQDTQGLGNRAVCNITFADHPHTDRIVDPYVDGRSYDPMKRGSFWTKWLVRNKYRQNVLIRVYEGYSGQALSDMTKRTYFLQSVGNPDSGGRVTIQGKDILARVEERKAQIPAASPGVLVADITATQMSIEVARATVADYPAPGTVRVGDETMSYTAVAPSAYGVILTLNSRATNNTTAATHSALDGVQLCLLMNGFRVDDAINVLLRASGIDPAYLDLAQWAAEIDDYLSLFILNAFYTEPTPITKIVSDIQEQAQVYVWWDERFALVRLRAVRGIGANVPLLTAESHILAGSFSVQEKPRERVSQLWIYYRRKDWIKDRDDPAAYVSPLVIADLESETAVKYGEPSIRKVYANWITSEALASTSGVKIMARNVEIPSECKFRMDAKDRAYWVGDTVTISHHLDVDAYGNRRLQNWTIVSAEEVVPGEVVEYIAENTTLYGTVAFVMADGSPDYTVPVVGSAYIGDSLGLLPDGTTCARIS